MHDVIIDVMVITSHATCTLVEILAAFGEASHALTASSHGQWQGNVMITNNA